MLGLSATYNYYLFNGSVDMRKGVFGLAEAVRSEMAENPLNSNNVFIFMAKNRKVVKILHYERGFSYSMKSVPLQDALRSPYLMRRPKSSKSAGRIWFV